MAKRNKIYGTNNDDVLNGTAGNDDIRGFGGHDVILAGAGNDRINAGNGNNIVDAGAGNNTIKTGRGNDTITAGSGNNRIDAGDGNNSIRAGGNTGAQRIKAGDGDDDISTGGGSDWINAGHGNNRIGAGSGNDTIKAGNGDDDIFGGGGSNTIDAGNGNNIIVALSGNNIIRSGNGNDSIEIDSGGNDRIDSGGGNDVLFSSGGNDTINAGAGDDLFLHFVFDHRNPNNHDVYRGGAGLDTLQLDILSTDWNGNAALQQDVLRYADFLTALNHNPSGEVGGREFRFSTFDLRAAQIEKVVVMVDGTEATAAITGDSTGTVKEDDAAQTTTSGKLAVFELDPADRTFQNVDAADLQGDYGTFTFNTATGDWSYTIDNSLSAVQELYQTPAHDQLTVFSRDGTASQVIDITVEGTNEAPSAIGASVSTVVPPTGSLDLDHYLIDPDHNGVDYTVLTSSPGVTLTVDDSTGVVSWTTVGISEFSFIGSVVDAGGLGASIEFNFGVA